MALFLFSVGVIPLSCKASILKSSSVRYLSILSTSRYLPSQPFKCLCIAHKSGKCLLFTSISPRISRHSPATVASELSWPGWQFVLLVAGMLAAYLCRRYDTTLLSSFSTLSDEANQKEAIVQLGYGCRRCIDFPI